MSGLVEALRAVHQETQTLGLVWYVFGAQAVAAHGIPRATQDLDVTVMANRAQAHKLASQLENHGISHRFPDIADDLLTNGAVLPLRHQESGFELDLVLGGTEMESLAAARAEYLTIAGILVPVCSPTDLAVGKSIAGRPIDLHDVAGLVAGGRVNIPEVRAILRAVEQAVGEDGMVARFNLAVARVQP